MASNIDSDSVSLKIILIKSYIGFSALWVCSETLIYFNGGTCFEAPTTGS